MSKVAAAQGSEARIPDFDEVFEMEADSFWFRGRNQLIIWGLGSYFGEARSFLEIGCGTGFVLSGIQQSYPQLSLSGAELYDEGLAYARQRLPEVSLVQLDARRMPNSNAYDVIGAFDVLEHIEEDDVVLQELYKASRQGIIITVPQHKFLWSALDEYSGHKRRYVCKELCAKVEKAGFTVVRTTSFISLLLPLLAITRLQQRSQQRLRPGSELRLPKLLDRTLELILNVETWLIRLGISMPLGGSLMIVARKTPRASFNAPCL